MSSELENSGIRVAVGDCSVTERRRWRPPYQTGKTVHVHAKHYIHDEDGRTAPGVCGNGSVPLSHSGNVVTRIGINTHTHTWDPLKCGEPGLVDRVLALHAGSRGFDSTRGHMSERFSDPVDQDIRTQWALSWKIVVSEWRSLIAVNAKQYKHNEDGRTAPGVCGNGSVPLSHSGSVVTRIGIHTQIH